MKTSFIFLILISLTTNLLAETLTNELLKNETYKSVYEFIKNDPAITEGSDKLQMAIQQQQALTEDPNSRAKLYYQQKVDQEPCQHCPRYLDLVLAVNKIVEKVNIEDTVQNNQKLIQLSKLNFLYYLTKTTLDDGTIECSKFTGMDLNAEKEIKRGTIKLAAEVALALPNITEVQYYATGGREVHYFYRGEGEDNNTIIEVIMAQNNPALIKYYKYESPYNLPDLGGGNSRLNQTTEDKNNYLVINPSVERENLILPTNLNLGKAGMVSPLSESLNLRVETQASYNQQKGTISLETNSGKKYLLLENINTAGGPKSIRTIVNYDIPLVEDTGLMVTTFLESKIEKADNIEIGIQNSETMTLALTDKDSEYFKIKTVSDNLGINSYILGNNLKIGDGTIATEFQFDRDGNRQYNLNLIDQGPFKQSGIKYQIDVSGERIVAANMGTAIDNRTTLNTEISHSNIDRNKLALKLERNINSTDSMVVQISGSDIAGYNLLYQYQKKLD
jgi:hypothetical protein